MNTKKLSIIISLLLMFEIASAMRYQIKVLNTPTIIINNKEHSVGDWFDDKSVILWSHDYQAMRVLSEDNRVYTLSAKLYKEIKASKFSDFIKFTKPLATRGNGSQTFQETLENIFDNNFIMLDEIVINLSSVEIPQNLSIIFTIGDNTDKKGNFIIIGSTAILKRSALEELDLDGVKNLHLNVYMQSGDDEPILITDNMGVEILPVETTEQNTIKGIQDIVKTKENYNISSQPLNPIDSLLYKAEIAYHIDANDTLACQYVDEAMNLIDKEDSDQKFEYAKLMSLWCQYGTDEFREEAILRGEKALQFFRELNLSYNRAECLSTLAYLYSVTEDSLNVNSRKSVEYCFKALELIDIKNDSEIYASILSHLSGAYISVGKYQKAIEVADSCIAYSDSCLKTQKRQTILYAKYSDAYSLALHNKAIALYYQGRYLDCLTCNKTNLQFRLDTWEKTSRYAICARNLAMVEDKLGLYADSYNHFLECYNTYEKINQLPLSEMIELSCYMIENDIKRGELFLARYKYPYIELLVESNKLDIEKYPETYGLFLSTAVNYWLYVGDYANAFDYLYRAEDANLQYVIDDDVYIQMQIQVCQDSTAFNNATSFQEIYDTSYGKDNIKSINNLLNVVKSAMSIHNWTVADSCANRYLYGMRKHIGKMFPSMTSEDRELFHKKIYNNLFKYLPSFFNYTRRKGFDKAMYDLALLNKGLLLRTEQELIKLVQSSNNNEALELYYEIQDNTANLKRANNQVEYDSLSNILHQQQLSLQKMIPSFDKIVKQYDISWEDVKNSLKKDEIAIEFVDITDHNTGNKSCKALVLKHDWNFPYYIDLFNETDLCNIDKEDYYTTSHLFALIWNPIYAKILQYEDSITKVYFSPSEMISQIAIESLIDYWDQNRSEKYAFHRLSSTRELVLREEKTNIKNAVVYGGLIYDAEIQDIVNNNKQFDIALANMNRSSASIIDSLENKRAGIRYLPATKIEGEIIESKFKNNNIQCSFLNNISGTEESFYALEQSNTNILHVATHGFYWSQSELDSLHAKRDVTLSQIGLNTNLSTEEKAMTRSGLFLSGANLALSGQELPNNTCDGILTAYEISKLDLTSVDLAVLSACETGLGEIKSGEGVYGLQRGFKKAGTNSILMSLWKVDDDATQKLMTEFYENLLNGKTKAQSLLNAQRCVKSQPGWEGPEYWAGFILLDGLN